jgi:hypothetical protein
MQYESNSYQDQERKPGHMEINLFSRRYSRVLCHLWRFRFKTSGGRVMPSSKPSKPTPYDIHMAEMAEPYQDNEGVIGFAIPLEPGHWEAHNKWSETNPELGALLEKKQIVPWYLPTKPDPSDSLDDLYIAINQILGEYIWFPDARNNSLISNWILTSWIYDLHEYSPRIYLYATTKSGKSHTLEAINQLSYHGLKSLVNPTPAVLYRII